MLPRPADVLGKDKKEKITPTINAVSGKGAIPSPREVLANTAPPTSINNISPQVIGPYNTDDELAEIQRRADYQNMGRNIPVLGNVLRGMDVVGEKIEPVADFMRSIYTPGAGAAPVQAAYRGVSGLINRLAPKLGNTMPGRVAQEAIKEAAVSVPVAGGQTLASGQTDLKEVAKQAALGGAMGAGVGSVVPVAGAALRRISRNTPTQEPVTASQPPIQIRDGPTSQLEPRLNTEPIQPRRATDFVGDGGDTLAVRQSTGGARGLGEYAVKRTELESLIKNKAETKDIKAVQREMREIAQNMDGDKLAERLYIKPPTMKEVNGIKTVNADDFTPRRIKATVDFALDHAKIDWDTAKNQNLVFGNFKTMHRLINNLFGESTLKSDPKNLLKRTAIDSFDDAKAQMHRHIKVISDEIKDNLVKHGVTKNSRKSAMAMALGEGKVSLDEVKRQFPNDWQHIVSAKDYARKYYDDMIDMQNEVLRKIYANLDGERLAEKLIPKREDYFRHIQEQNAKFKDITDLLDTAAGIRNVDGTARGMIQKIKEKVLGRPIQIDPELVGVSEYTNPKSKWNPTRLRRTSDTTDFDLMAGLIDYTNHASYQIYVSPYIQVLDALTDGLKMRAPKGNLNNYIEVLNGFKEILQGKTSFIDRLPQKIVGREVMRSLDAINTRVRKNSVLMSTSAMMAQWTHLPNAYGIGGAKNFAQGMKDYVKYVMTRNAENPIKQSSFMQERYVTNDLMRQFERGLINKVTDKAGKISLEVVDKMAGEMTWHTMYNKALKEGVDNPVRRADDLTRDILGARGRGEKSIIMSARTPNFIMPFQLEVANNTMIMGELLKNRQHSQFAQLMLANLLFNGFVGYTVGRKFMFDPLKAMHDAYKLAEEEDKNTQKVIVAAGRLAGEVLSSIPLGQNITSLAVPNEVTRQKFFGEVDPTRYGTDPIIVEAVNDPLFKFATPFGGSQLKRTLQGAKSFAQGGYYGPNLTDDIKSMVTGKETEDKLRFPIEQDLETFIRALSGGVWNTRDGREYLDNNRSPLSVQQTEDIRRLSERGRDTRALYDVTMIERELAAINRKINEVRDNRELSSEERNARRRELINERTELRRQRREAMQRSRGA